MFAWLVAYRKKPALTRVLWPTPAMFFASGWLRKTPRTENRRSVCRAWLMFRGSSIGRGEVTLGKPGVASMACAAGIVAGNTQRGLRMQPAAILRSVWRPTETCCDSRPWHLTSKNKWVIGLIVEHFYVTFGDFSCIGFWDKPVMRIQNAGENRTPRLPWKRRRIVCRIPQLK